MYDEGFVVGVDSALVDVYDLEDMKKIYRIDLTSVDFKMVNY